jgi:anaerobic magnesium-protoporphyrin IX monomethyl ester cyclase
VVDVSSITLCSATLGEDGVFEPPLGPLYVAAALEEMNVDVDFRDFQLAEGAHGLSGEKLAQFLAGHADVVAISCFVDMLPAVIDAARRLHDDRPETVFLLGGPGPTAAARRILEEYPWITAVVRGEGEETVQEWFAAVRAGVKLAVPVDGMIYRAGDVLVDGADRVRNRRLDDLPLPAYHMIDWNRYTRARIITTRGCAYRCSFCDVTALWGNRSVYRGIEATLTEIELLRDRYGRSSISVVDDTFVLNRKRVAEFCRALIERRAGIEWGCFGRINLMTPELIELMAAAGCRGVFYGIDSGSQPVLDRTVKKLRAQDVMPVLERSCQYFGRIEASFIWGYPFETLDDFKRTLELAGEASMLAPTVNVQLHMLSPLPLSPIYTEFKGQLLEPDPADQRWLLLPAVLLDERAVVVRELVRARPDIYPGFYAFPTPALAAKRDLLGATMRALERTIGATIFNPQLADLLDRDNPTLERAILAAQREPSDRIGVGLALGFFKRNRDATIPPSPGGHRGPSIVRERSDLVRR